MDILCEWHPVQSLSSPHEHGLGGELAHVAGRPVGAAGLPLQSAVNVGIVGVGGIWNGNQAVEAGKGARDKGEQGEATAFR